MGIFGGKSRTYVSVVSGVRGSFTGQHRSRSGCVHEHTWEVTVWFKGRNNEVVDATHVKKQLDDLLSGYSGKCLPDRIAWAEHLAGEIASSMYCRWDGYFVTGVDVVRHKEGLLVEWRRT